MAVADVIVDRARTLPLTKDLLDIRFTAKEGFNVQTKRQFVNYSVCTRAHDRNWLPKDSKGEIVVFQRYSRKSDPKGGNGA
jgi:hypothetical protein